MEFLLAVVAFVMALTAALAMIFWRRAAAAEARIAELERQLKKALAPKQDPVPDPVPDQKPPAEPEQEPEPKPKSKPKPRPKKTVPDMRPLRKARPSTDSRNNPVYKHAVEMTRQALEMTRHLGFDAQVDGNPHLYRVSLDLKTSRDQQASVLLEKAPFACIKKVEIKGDNMALVVDTQAERPQ